ncbi:hypothetical protein CALCODRAFT_485855, partial [Calocera cornea HHB12733]
MGRTLKDRYTAWHRQNPGQTAADLSKGSTNDSNAARFAPVNFLTTVEGWVDPPSTAAPAIYLTEAEDDSAYIDRQIAEIRGQLFQLENMKTQRPGKNGRPVPTLRKDKPVEKGSSRDPPLVDVPKVPIPSKPRLPEAAKPTETFTDPSIEATESKDGQRSQNKAPIESVALINRMVGKLRNTTLTDFT